jgi:hypothetical protein
VLGQRIGNLAGVAEEILELRLIEMAAGKGGGFDVED